MRLDPDLAYRHPRPQSGPGHEPKFNPTTYTYPMATGRGPQQNPAGAAVLPMRTHSSRCRRPGRRGENPAVCGCALSGISGSISGSDRHRGPFKLDRDAQWPGARFTRGLCGALAAHVVDACVLGICMGRAAASTHTPNSTWQHLAIGLVWPGPHVHVRDSTKRTWPLKIRGGVPFTLVAT